MDNKKYFKIIDNLKHYKDMMKPKYKHLFDTVAQLYTSRKIEKKITVENILNKLVSRGKAPLSAMKTIEKYYNRYQTEKRRDQTKRRSYVSFNGFRIDENCVVKC